MSEKRSLSVAEVIAISSITYFVLDWLKTKPFGDTSIVEGVIAAAIIVIAIILYGVFKGWQAGREFEKEHLQEAKRHGYLSWAEYMAVEGDEFVRDSWESAARRERNRLSRRLSRIFTRKD